jgi:hypothetical protein
MHEMSLEVGSERRRDLRIDERLLPFVAVAMSSFGAHLAVGHDDDGSFGEMLAPRGLESGLPGLYRVMGFGPVLVDLIGRHRLDDLGAVRRTASDDGAVVLRFDESVSTPLTPEVVGRLAALRRALGESYFCRPPRAEGGLESLGGGQIGLFSFLRAMLSEKRQVSSTDRMATVRPSFDWSGVFGAN